MAAGCRDIESPGLPCAMSRKARVMPQPGHSRPVNPLTRQSGTGDSQPGGSSVAATRTAAGASRSKRRARVTTVSSRSSAHGPWIRRYLRARALTTGSFPCGLRGVPHTALRG